MTDETRTQGTRDCYNTGVPVGPRHYCANAPQNLAETCNAKPHPSMTQYMTVCWERDSLRDAYVRVSGELAGAAARIRELEDQLRVQFARAESAEGIARSFGVPIGDPATVAVNDLVEDLREQLRKSQEREKALEYLVDSTGCCTPCEYRVVPNNASVVVVGNVVKDLRQQLAKERLDRATLVEQHRAEIEKMCAECSEVKFWRRVLEVAKGRG